MLLIKPIDQKKVGIRISAPETIVNGVKTYQPQLGSLNRGVK